MSNSIHFGMYTRWACLCRLIVNRWRFFKRRQRTIGDVHEIPRYWTRVVGWILSPHEFSVWEIQGKKCIACASSGVAETQADVMSCTQFSTASIQYNGKCSSLSKYRYFPAEQWSLLYSGSDSLRRTTAIQPITLWGARITREKCIDIGHTARTVRVYSDINLTGCLSRGERCNDESCARRLLDSCHCGGQYRKYTLYLYTCRYRVSLFDRHVERIPTRWTLFTFHTVSRWSDWKANLALPSWPYYMIAPLAATQCTRHCTLYSISQSLAKRFSSGRQCAPLSIGTFVSTRASSSKAHRFLLSATDTPAGSRFVRMNSANGNIFYHTAPRTANQFGIK